MSVTQRVGMKPVDRETLGAFDRKPVEGSRMSLPAKLNAHGIDDLRTQAQDESQ